MEFVLDIGFLFQIVMVCLLIIVETWIRIKILIWLLNK